MSYRDELEAAHARIEALLRQLASTQPARESDALRAMSEELREARQLLATHESLTAHTRASSEAHVASVNAVRAAETARVPETVLKNGSVPAPSVSTRVPLTPLASR